MTWKDKLSKELKMKWKEIMKDMNNEGRNLQVTSAMLAGEFKTEPVYLLKYLMYLLLYIIPILQYFFYPI